MDLTAYIQPGWKPYIRPAPTSRAWMDATSAFAYRCLPLTIANAHGWELLSPAGLSAIWNGGKGLDDVVLRQPLDNSLLVRRLRARVDAVGGELVVQVVVVRLERRRLRRPLAAPPAVDVEVRQDPQQPSAQVRARRVRAPRPECARVRLLYELLRVLARGSEMAGDAEHLVGQRQCLFFEAHPVARFGRDPGRVIRHDAHGNATNVRRPRVIPAAGGIPDS